MLLLLRGMFVIRGLCCWGLSPISITIARAVVVELLLHHLRQLTVYKELPYMVNVEKEIRFHELNYSYLQSRTPL